MPIQPPQTDIIPPSPADMATFDQGLALVDLEKQKGANRLAEEAMVKKWFDRIDSSRMFDDSAYKQLAVDRAYARGDSAFRTKSNVIGAYIDTWTSLLYARDPDVDVAAAPKVGEQGLQTARLFGDTLEIVINKLWKKARMKDHAKPWVRSGLTSQISWLKITWQERAGSDPVTDQAISDLQDNLHAVQRALVDLKSANASCESEELRAEQLRLAIKGLQDKAEPQISKGLCIDLVDMQDITVSEEAPSIGRYLDSPWIAHRSYLRMHQARALFPDLTTEELKDADTYSQKRPIAAISDQSGSQVSFNANDANGYTSHENQSAYGDAGGAFVCAEEVWDRDTNQIFTLVRGVKGYARSPYSPTPATTRFYPFFGLVFTAVDGQRWPQSLNQRSQSLQDAYSRSISAFEEHRSRIKPKTVFQAGMMDPTEISKLEKAATQEMVAIKTTNPKQDLRQLLVPVSYAAIDMGIYDTAWIMKNFELVWGLQEAMTGQIDTAKTATEAEIQQSGSNSRTSDKRDQLEEVLSEVSQYTAEIAVQQISAEEVRVIAGVEAFWPEGITPEDLDQLGVVSIRAGSSGKPNSRQQREMWGAVMPMMQGLMTQIAKLRQSSPLDVADKLEELIVETAARSGEQLDPARFIPQVGEPLMLIDPKTLQPVMAYPAPVAEGDTGTPPAGPAQPQPFGTGDSVPQVNPPIPQM
jgi:hypothetical protein